MMVIRDKKIGDLEYRLIQKKLELGSIVWGYWQVLNKRTDGKPDRIDGVGVTDDSHLMNNFLFEFDGLSKEEQDKIIGPHRDKVARAVFSGRNSIHCIINAENAPTTKRERAWLWNYLNDNLFNGLCDAACKNNARRTRKPGNPPHSENKGEGMVVIYGASEELWSNDVALKINWKEEYEKEVLIQEWIKERRLESQPHGKPFPEKLFNKMVLNHTTKNGGRGFSLVRIKYYMDSHCPEWTNEMITRLANAWGCPEKIERILNKE